MSEYWTQEEDLAFRQAAGEVDRGSPPEGRAPLYAVEPSHNGASGKPVAQPQTGRRVVLTPASSITSESVSWCWEDRVALGALSILAGEPGLGKSTTTAYMAARLSRGELDGALFGKPCGVLIATLEDHWAAVVKPRLEAAGADLTRIQAVIVKGDDGHDTTLTLPDDLALIEDAAEGLDPRLLIVDPLVATLAGKTDSYKDHDVRRALAPLAAYADRAGIAVLCVMHLTKGQSENLLNRVSGSIGFGGAARSVLAFMRDPDDPLSDAGYDRLLLHIKSNWGKYAQTVRCAIDSAPVDLGDGTSASQALLRIVGECDISAADLSGGNEPGQADEADEFLDEQLGDCAWHPRKEIRRQADSQKLAWKTVERAAKKRGVERVRKGEFHAQSEWRLPLAPTPLAQVDATDAWREYGNGSTEPNPADSGSTRAISLSDGASGENGGQIDADLDARVRGLDSLSEGDAEAEWERLTTKFQGP